MESLLETMKSQDRRMKLAFEAQELMWARKEREWLRKEKEYLQREVEWRAKEQAWLEREQKLLQERRDSDKTVTLPSLELQTGLVETPTSEAVAQDDTPIMVVKCDYQDTEIVLQSQPSPIVEGDQMEVNPSIDLIPSEATNLVAEKGDCEILTAQEAEINLRPQWLVEKSFSEIYKTKEVSSNEEPSEYIVEVRKTSNEVEAEIVQPESGGSTENLEVVEVPPETPAQSDLGINLRPQWLIRKSFNQIYGTPSAQEVSIETPENIQEVVEGASSEPIVSQVDSKTLTPDNGEPLEPPTVPPVVETEEDILAHYKNKKKKKRGKNIQAANDIATEIPEPATQDVSTEMPIVFQVEQQTLGVEDSMVSTETSESVNLRPQWLIQRSFSQIYTTPATQEVSIETPENLQKVGKGTSSKTVTAVDDEVLEPLTGLVENPTNNQEPTKPEETEEDLSVYFGINWNKKKKKKKGKKKLVFDFLEDSVVPSETPAQSDYKINLRPQWLIQRSFSQIYPTPATQEVFIETAENIQELVEEAPPETFTAFDDAVLQPPTGLVENLTDDQGPTKPEETEEDLSVYLGINWNQKKNKGKNKLMFDFLEDSVLPETPTQSDPEINLRPQRLLQRSFSQIYPMPATEEVSIETTKNIETLGFEPQNTPTQSDPEINLRPQWLIQRSFSQIYPTPVTQEVYIETTKNIQEVVTEASFEPGVYEVDSKTFTPKDGEPLESPTENNKPVVSRSAPLQVETEQDVQTYYKNKKKKKRGKQAEKKQRASEIQTETPAQIKPATHEIQEVVEETSLDRGVLTNSEYKSAVVRIKPIYEQVLSDQSALAFKTGGANP